MDGNIYALKKVKLLNLSEKEKLNALNEVRILASVKSQFVISYKEAFFDDKDSTLGIVMEFADNGDLYQKIVEHKKAAMFFEESDIWRIFIQLVKGLKALHDLKILHRDLKSANVFLENDGSAKLGDLNVSKVARRGIGYTQTGTPYYASPEVWKDQPYDSKSDIWSLGCVLYEMITLRPPFRAENMEGLYNKVIRGQYSRLPERFSKDLQTIVKMLLQVSSQSRPSCDQILKHPIIQNRIEYFKSYGSEENLTEDQALLKTIKIPKNLLFLSDKLPKPNYKEHGNPIHHSSNNQHYRSFSNNRELENTQNQSEVPSSRSKHSKNKEIKMSNDSTANNNGSPSQEEKSKRLKMIRAISSKVINEESENSNEINASNNLRAIEPSSAYKGHEYRKEARYPDQKNPNIINIRNRNLSPIRRDNKDLIKIQRNNIIDNQNHQGELPQLNIIHSSIKIEPSKNNNNIINNRLKANNYNRNSQHMNDLYKIYAPYLNNPNLKPLKKYNERLRSNDNHSPLYYLNNLEKYYNRIIANRKKISEGPERKMIPNKKLSPLRKKPINLS